MSAPDIVYIVMASSGEYSDRVEWVCWVGRDADEAKRLAEHWDAIAREYGQLWMRWLNGRAAAADVVMRTGDWTTDQVVEAQKAYDAASPKPDTPNPIPADRYWVVAVPMGQWGEWTSHEV